MSLLFKLVYQVGNYDIECLGDRDNHTSVVTHLHIPMIGIRSKVGRASY
jgi:hypothetical protein